MRIKFWGTRGSIAKPGPATARYGGNTSCVEIRSAAGTIIVLDCGTGGHDLGQHLAAEHGGAVDGHLLISHTHWDHIQGIPFFAPLFNAKNTWDVYGPKGLSQSLHTTLAGQMEHTYFPVALDQFAAKIRYHDLVEGVFSIGSITVTTRYLNHPALTLGYRLEADGVSVAYCCDHEPYSADLATGNSAITGTDLRYADFVAGADVVIHDTQYTAEEYPKKIGWGHSPVEYAVRVCRDSGVKQLLLTHHDPLRDDDAIDRITDGVRQRLRTDGSSMEVRAAAEGMTLQLTGDRQHAAAPAKDQFQAETTIDAIDVARPVLLYLTDRDLISRLTKAISEEGLLCHVATDEQDLLCRVTADQPSLVLIGHRPPQLDGDALARAIRRSEAPGDIQVPVVLVAAANNQAQREHSIATDWLIAPFSMSYARTKIRAWALRAACRWIRAQLPVDENRRLKALGDLAILDTPAEERFDRVTRIAAAALNVPIALVSLVDSERQWFKSCYGLNTRETSRDLAFCAHVVHQRAEMIVPDTLLDDRFADNLLVLHEPRIRFYAGAPLLLDDGSCIGTLCLIDTRPRELSPDDLVILRDLRDLVLDEIQRKSG